MKSDAEFFVGNWDAVTPGLEGEMWGNSTWRVNDTLEVQIAYPEEGGRFTEWQLSLDPNQSPKQLNLGGFIGIYEIEGDTIRVATSSGNRPTNFEPKDGVSIRILQRAKPK